MIMCWRLSASVTPSTALLEVGRYKEWVVRVIRINTVAWVDALINYMRGRAPSVCSCNNANVPPSNSTNNKDATNKEEEEEDGRDTEDAAQPSTLLSHHSTLNEGGGAGGGVEDSVSSTLALLASEGLPSVVESHLSQGTGLTLSDLTSDSMIVDLLNTTAQDSSANFSSSSLETSAAYLTLCKCS